MRSATLLAIFFVSVLSAIAQSNAKGFIGVGLADAPGSGGAMVGVVSPEVRQTRREYNLATWSLQSMEPPWIAPRQWGA